jgi:phosphatidate cytidylyltransferase
MLKRRVLTAIVLLLLIFAMMCFLKPPIFAVLVMPFYWVSAAEWAKLMGFESLWARGAYTVLIAAALGIAALLPASLLLAASLLCWLWAAAAVCCYQQDGVRLLGFQYPWIPTCTGVLMLAACWKAIVLLQAASPLWLIMALGICWVVDTGAYFSGRRFGRHPLAVRVSPKKTWEGFWGGILLAIAVIAVSSLFLPLTPAQRSLLILLTACCTLFAVIGDLFISLLKRQAGLKDSGSLLPGHGGLLDRVDSTISVLPVFGLGFLLLRL